MLPALRACTSHACTHRSVLHAMRCSTRATTAPAPSLSGTECSRILTRCKSISGCSTSSASINTGSSMHQRDELGDFGGLKANGSSLRHHSTQAPRPSRDGVRCQSSGGDTASTSGKSKSVLTLPNVLTLARVVAIPAVIAGFFWTSPQAPTFCTVLFVGAALTDWLDGYLARKTNSSSAFGAFLDPVADKLMVAAVLILMCTQPLVAGPWAGNSWIMPVLTLVIIGREITMSALREWAAIVGPAASAAVAVNSWGKWKTATQMVSLTLLLLTRDGASGPLMEAAATAAVPLLSIAAYLSVHSLAIYLKGLWRFMT